MVIFEKPPLVPKSEIKPLVQSPLRQTSENKNIKPCNMECNKCGSLDIHRLFYYKGKTMININDFDKESFKLISKTGDYCEVLEDCIIHHCRECHYAWVTSPMNHD